MIPSKGVIRHEIPSITKGNELKKAQAGITASPSRNKGCIRNRNKLRSQEPREKAYIRARNTKARKKPDLAEGRKKGASETQRIFKG